MMRNSSSVEFCMPFVSEAVVNNNERNEKLFQHKKKIYKIHSDQIKENSFLSEILKMQLEHSKELVVILPMILQIKQAVSRASRSQSALLNKRFQRFPNLTVVKSNCACALLCVQKI